MSASLTTGCSISYRSTASRMLFDIPLALELGRVDADQRPTRSGYACSSFLSSGRMWMQLMQQKVQKSSSTNLPRSSSSLTGFVVLSHSSCRPTAAGTRCGNGCWQCVALGSATAMTAGHLPHSTRLATYCDEQDADQKPYETAGMRSNHSHFAMTCMMIDGYANECGPIVWPPALSLAAKPLAVCLAGPILCGLAWMATDVTVPAAVELPATKSP